MQCSDYDCQPIFNYKFLKMSLISCHNYNRAMMMLLGINNTYMMSMKLEQ